MAFFYKRETLIRSISLMAIMAAINVVFSVLTLFVPLLSVILVIFLPLTSAVVEVCCKDRYFPIYAFATIGLSIVVSLSVIDFTIFYVVPSIIAGYIFGLMSKKNLPDFLSIFVASCAQTILSFALIPLINLITERNFFADIIELLKIQNIDLFKKYLILIFFAIALAQTFLSFVVVDSELKKINVKTEDKKDHTLIVGISGIFCQVMLVGFAFFETSISFICLGFVWYFALFSIIYAFKNQNKLQLMLSAFGLLLNIFMFAAFNSKFENGNEFLLLGIAPLLVSLLSIGFYFLKKQKCKIK